MRKLRICLDTSVINFLFADDAPEKRDATRAFITRARQEGVALYISQVVIDEILRTPDARKRQALLDAVAAHALRMLAVDPVEEIERLARAYLDAGALPAGEVDDALHVAVCTVNQADVLASWNFKHLANVCRERRIVSVNEACGYMYPLRIVSPEGVLDNEDDE